MRKASVALLARRITAPLPWMEMALMMVGNPGLVAPISVSATLVVRI